MAFLPDPAQISVLEHEEGPLLATGGPGTGKTAVLRERFARLIEAGADPERVALVVRTKRERRVAKDALLTRLRSSLPDLNVLTVHALAFRVVTARHRELGFEQPPSVLTAADQFAKVRDLLEGENPADWPEYGSMLGLRGFADAVRQFLLRAQEALIAPDEIGRKAAEKGLRGWAEVAAFYRRYLQVLDDEGLLDFAGLLEQAAAAAGRGEPLFDHILVDDYQEATFALERMLAESRPRTLAVAGDEGSHVFSFQGTTDEPLRRFSRAFPTAVTVQLETQHRAVAQVFEAWFTQHSAEEHAAAARELRRIHVEEEVPWEELAVIVRRQGSHLGGLLRALDDAGVPRSTPERGLSILAEPATYPFVLALRWLARPHERDGLVEALLTSDLARISPAAARGMVRAARRMGNPPAAAIDVFEGLSEREAVDVASLREVLLAAEEVADVSVLEAFSILWRQLPYARRLVDAGGESAEGRRDLDAVLAFSEAVSRAGQREGSSVEAFLELLEAGQEGPGYSAFDRQGAGATNVLTAHGAAGMEFDTVIVVGTVEGNFPSLSRPEPMFDLVSLDGARSQAERNRLRLEDERRLFDVVAGRARRRVLFTASDPHGEETRLSTRSRFVAERGIEWRAAPRAPFDSPLTVAEAGAAWRRLLADASAPSYRRLAAIEGLVALGADPGGWWFQRDWTDTGEPLHESIRVSFSRLNTLENCELQYVLAEELGLENRAGYQAWVGHLVHQLIEDCERGEVQRDLDVLIAEAGRRWRQEQFPSFAVSEAFRRLVMERILPAWWKEFGGSEPLASEVGFSFEFEGATVSGKIDRVGRVEAGGSQISDYKTGKVRNAGKADESLQLGIYYMAVNRAEELAPFRPVRAVELVFLRDENKREGGISRVSKALTAKDEPEYSAAMEERLSGLIGRVRTLLETETYRPNPAANCRFCHFKPLCPLWPEGGELFPLVARSQP